MQWLLVLMFELVMSTNFFQTIQFCQRRQTSILVIDVNLINCFSQYNFVKENLDNNGMITY